MKLTPDVRADVLHAWSVYLSSRDMQSMMAAMSLTRMAVAGAIVPGSIVYPPDLSREIEADFREMLAAVQAQRPKRKRSSKAIKRKAFKHCVPLDANAPILCQVRSLGR